MLKWYKLLYYKEILSIYWMTLVKRSVASKLSKYIIQVYSVLVLIIILKHTYNKWFVTFIMIRLIYLRAPAY